MVVLNQEEKKVIEKVVDGMTECGLFCGKYDAKNGSAEFMHGISTVMEYLAYLVSDEYGAEFDETFLKNMIKSKKKVLTNEH